MKSDKWVNLGAVLYCLGSVVDWTYWVARGVEPATEGVSEHLLGAILGVPISVVWPLHVLVEAWFWILS